MRPRYATKMVTRIAPSTRTNQTPLLIGSVSVMRPGVTLKSATAKPIAITNAKMSAPRESSLSGSSVVSTPSSCAA